MNLINLIEISWNNYNGFVFQILDLELKKPNISAPLLGINFSKDFLYIYLFFKEIVIYERPNF